MSRGGKPFIPRSDAHIGVWATQFWLTADGLVPGVPIPQAEVDAVEGAMSEWFVSWEALQIAKAAYEAALQEKDTRRATLERTARTLARTVQAMPQITDADRAKFGIPLARKGNGHRVLRSGADPAPTTAPLIEIKHIGTRTHTLRLSDSATPLRRALPRGAKWAEVWLAVGEGTRGAAKTQSENLKPQMSDTPGEPGSDSDLSPAPAGLRFAALSFADFRFLRITTNPLVRTTFDAADVGKQARYMLRWVGHGNTPGPWSEVCSATVAA